MLFPLKEHKIVRWCFEVADYFC